MYAILSQIVALRILGVALTVDEEKGVALQVGEAAASHLTFCTPLILTLFIQVEMYTVYSFRFK